MEEGGMPLRNAPYGVASARKTRVTPQQAPPPAEAPAEEPPLPAVPGPKAATKVNANGSLGGAPAAAPVVGALPPKAAKAPFGLPKAASAKVKLSSPLMRHHVTVAASPRPTGKSPRAAKGSPRQPKSPRAS